MLSCLTEFNEEVYRKGIREESIISAIKMSKNYNVTKDATIEQLIAQFELSPEEATELVTLHWE